MIAENAVNAVADHPPPSRRVIVGIVLAFGQEFACKT